MRAWLSIAVLAAACDGGGGSGQDYYTEEGECEAPEGATELATTPADLWQPACFVETYQELLILESEGDWDAMFDCDTTVPTGLDFSTQRAAIVSVMCSPTSYRFAAETDDEVVIGVKTGISGACIGNVIVVPLARSAKPVRLARCWDECHGECPPVP